MFKFILMAFGFLLIGSFIYGMICVIRESILKSRIKKNMPDNFDLANRKLQFWSARCTPMQMAYEIRLNPYNSAWNELVLPGILTELYASGAVLFDEAQNRIGFRMDTAEPAYRRAVLDVLCRAAQLEAARTGKAPEQQEAWTWIRHQSFLETVFTKPLDRDSKVIWDIGQVMERESQALRKTEKEFHRDMEFIRHTYELQYREQFVTLEEVLQSAGGGRVDVFRLLLFLNLAEIQQLQDKPRTMLNIMTLNFLHYKNLHRDTTTD